MKTYLFAIIAILTLSGCAPSFGLLKNQHFYEPTVLTGIGLGAQYEKPNQTTTQAEIMSIRASKVAAYRDLAEQLYGVTIDGETTVRDLADTDDSFQAHVKGLVKGARTISITPLGDGTYETRLALTLDTEFTVAMKQSLGTYRLHSSASNRVIEPRPNSKQEALSLDDSELNDWLNN